VGADPQTDLASEIARLGVSIDRAATATEIMLAEHPPDAEHHELRRQLAALRERVAQAHRRDDGPQALRAELATLLCFAGTLQADAGSWRSARADRARELERRQAVARQEERRLDLERENLLRRRETLQSTILQTAARMAQETRGECRRTLPVITLGEGLTVCSVSVSFPRRGLRLAGQRLVTLSRSHNLLVLRE
jgi:multidrug efflux pump subunit AcrA (membrane-fusion protein)